jgi:hypothetical protein
VCRVASLIERKLFDPAQVLEKIMSLLKALQITQLHAMFRKGLIDRIEGINDGAIRVKNY